MNESAIDCFLLPDAAVGDLPIRLFGKLDIVLTEVSEATPFTMLDCFDQSLRHSGRLLLQTKTAVELLSDEGRLTIQPASHKIRFVADIKDSALKHGLKGLSPLRSLLPVGSGQIRRATMALVDDEQKTHCRAHFLFLTTKEGGAAVLVVLQRIKGYDESLNLLREQTKDTGGIALSCGLLYEQLFPTLSSYNAKPEIPIANDETAFNAASKIISACISVARKNEFGIVADHDTEFLHDYRIQLRKIRSVLSLFKRVYSDAQTSELKARFSSLMAPTGQLRDVDVYLLDERKFYALLPPNLHSGLDGLFRMLAKQRKSTKNKLAHHLRSQHYTLEIADLARLFAHPEELAPGLNANLAAHEYACDLIWNRYRKVCKIAVDINPDTSDAQIHELRIHCKKLRYLMEFFSPAFSAPELPNLLKRLKNLQENLGLFNDYSVQKLGLQALLLKQLKTKNAKHLEIAQSINALITIFHSRQLEERAKVMKNFARFNRPQTQRVFSAIFQERKEYT